MIHKYNASTENLRFNSKFSGEIVCLWGSKNLQKLYNLKKDKQMQFSSGKITQKLIEAHYKGRMHLLNLLKHLNEED
jgi:hypothetical protein